MILYPIVFYISITPEQMIHILFDYISTYTFITFAEFSCISYTIVDNIFYELSNVYCIYNTNLTNIQNNLQLHEASQLLVKILNFFLRGRVIFSNFRERSHLFNRFVNPPLVDFDQPGSDYLYNQNLAAYNNIRTNFNIWFLENGLYTGNFPFTPVNPQNILLTRQEFINITFFQN